MPMAILLGLCGLAFFGPLAAPSLAQPVPPAAFPPTTPEPIVTMDWALQLESLRSAAIRLPIAVALATLLAYRPRRRGTPKRQLAVVQTQIILAVVGAIVMLVVGASLARAFGIVGAAGLIRYRAKIEDPKDAGVMLSTLALGLASGVGQYALAAFAAVFVLITLWVLESLEPEPYQLFELTITTKDPGSIKERIEQVLRRHRVHCELRGNSADELSFEVKLPESRRTDTISKAIAAIDPKQTIEVEWEKKKEK